MMTILHIHYQGSLVKGTSPLGPLGGFARPVATLKCFFYLLRER